MNITKSMVLRAAVALSALTTGVVATVTLGGGASASDVARGSAAASQVSPGSATGTPSTGSPGAVTPSASAGSAATAAATPAAPAPQTDSSGQNGRPETVSAAPSAATPKPTSSKASPNASVNAPSNAPVGASGASPAAGAAQPAPAPLQPAQLPDSAAASWQPIAPPHTQAVTHQVRLNECAAVDSAANWQQQGYVSSFQTPAIQDSFTFADSADAQSAYRALLTAMDGCQDRSQTLQTNAKITADAKVTKTATSTDGTAYTRVWTGVAGISAPGPQTDHVYFVQRGSVLTVLQYGVPAGTDGDRSQTVSDDQAALAALSNGLDTPAAG